MVLTSQEAIYVREIILHRNKQRAVRKALPLIKEECIPDAIVYMEQNPLIQRHIDAGILYVYRDLVKNKKLLHEPKPLNTEEQRQLLQLIISGKRKSIKEVKSDNGLLETVLVAPSYEEIEAARWTLITLQRMSKNDLAA